MIYDISIKSRYRHYRFGNLETFEAEVSDTKAKESISFYSELHRDKPFVLDGEATHEIFIGKVSIETSNIFVCYLWYPNDHY